MGLKMEEYHGITEKKTFTVPYQEEKGA